MKFNTESSLIGNVTSALGRENMELRERIAELERENAELLHRLRLMDVALDEFNPQDVSEALMRARVALQVEDRTDFLPTGESVVESDGCGQ